MRKAINILQSVYNDLNLQITSKQCYNISGMISKTIITKLFNDLINPKKSLNMVFKYVENTILSDYNCLSILNELTKIMSDNIDKLITIYGCEKLCDIFIKLSNIEKNVSNSTFDNIYIIGIICIFKQ